MEGQRRDEKGDSEGSVPPPFLPHAHSSIGAARALARPPLPLIITLPLDHRYDGIVSTYSGGGNYQLLARDSGTAKEILQELKAGRWVTEGTRVLFVDFTVYNANINLFCTATEDIFWDHFSRGSQRCYHRVIYST